VPLAPHETIARERARGIGIESHGVEEDRRHQIGRDDTGGGEQGEERHRSADRG